MTRQNNIIPMQAKSTAMPWINDHPHGLACASVWLKIRSRCHADPIPWLITVNTMFRRNGAQSW